MCSSFLPAGTTTSTKSVTRSLPAKITRSSVDVPSIVSTRRVGRSTRSSSTLVSSLTSVGARPFGALNFTSTVAAGPKPNRLCRRATARGAV